MSASDLKRVGLSQGPSNNKAFPNKLFIVGLDGEGATEAERVEWIRSVFPKFADRLNPKDNDPRSNLPISEDEIRVFDPACAKPVVYESMGVQFPDGSGRWSGLYLHVVTTGRQTTKIARIVNERREAAGQNPIEIVVTGKRFASTLDRIKANVIENRQISATTPTQRAWGAHRMIENGMPDDEAMILVGVKTEQGLKNLLGLLECSPSVQRAVDLGPDDGGITQTVGLEIARIGDHEKQDAELAARLGAAEGKKGREKRQALRGEQDRPKPVKAKTVQSVIENLSATDRSQVDDAEQVDAYLAILRWFQGHQGAYDALPDPVKDAVKKSQIKAVKEKAPKPKTERKQRRKKVNEVPANDRDQAAA